MIRVVVCCLLLPALALADQQAPEKRSPAENRIDIARVDGAKRVALVHSDHPESADSVPACAPPCSLNVVTGSYRLSVYDGKVWTPSATPLPLIQPLTVVGTVDSRLGFRILGGVLSVAGLGGGVALMALATPTDRPVNVLQVVLGAVAIAAGLGGGLPLLFMPDGLHVQLFMPGAKLPR